MEVLVLIRGEIADSCGQKDTPTNIFASQCSSICGKQIYTCIDIRKKTLAKYCCRKVKSKPITLEKVFSSHSNLWHSCNCPSCPHAAALVPSLCWVLPHFKPDRGVSFAPKNYSAHYFSSKSHLNSQKQNVTGGSLFWHKAGSSVPWHRGEVRYTEMELALTSTKSVFLP